MTFLINRNPRLNKLELLHFSNIKKVALVNTLGISINNFEFTINIFYIFYNLHTNIVEDMRLRIRRDQRYKINISTASCNYQIQVKYLKRK